MTEIWGLPADEVVNHVERLAPFIQNFAERSNGRRTTESIWTDIAQRDTQVWVAGDYQAVTLTSVGDDWINIVCCAGTDRHDWMDDNETTLIEWARSLGKARIFMMCRPGWAKAAKQHGWREIHREMVKEI